MPHRWITIMGWTLVAWMLTSPVGALENADLRRVDAMLQRIEAAAVDPLTVERRVPEVPETAEALGTRQNMTIARAIRTMESATDTSLAILQGDVLTPLSLARNYRHLGMRRRALRWYDGAITADKERAYTLTLHREMSECAAEIGDSAVVVEALRRNLTLPRPHQVGEASARLLELLMTRPATPEVLELFESFEKVPGPRPARLQLVLARFWHSRGAFERAQELYRQVLARGDRVDLDIAARALKGLADSAADAGDVGTATRLYRRIREHDVGRLAAWSTYRLGQLAVNAGQLEEAEKDFRSICEREGATPWKDDACTQLGHTRQLMEIRAALRPYGLSLNLERGNAR